MKPRMDKEKVREVLKALDAKHRLTPNAVVEAAKSKTSPLHPLFTWDDKKAAAERRLDEARSLIERFKIEVTTTHYTMQVPEFVRDPTVGGKNQGYAGVVRLRSDKETAREVVISEFGRAASCLARAQAVAAALGLTKEIEKLQKRIVAIADGLQEQQVDAAA